MYHNGKIVLHIDYKNEETVNDINAGNYSGQISIANLYSSLVIAISKP